METTSKERVSYYVYFLGSNAILCLVASFAMLFYTDYVGISVSIIGTLFVLARIWDALSAPIFGVIIDRANLRGGLFKPWTNLASIILPILTVLIFLVPSDASLTVKVIYIAVTYLVWEMCYTISDAPGFGLATLMTKNTHERDLLMSRGRTMVFLAFMVISSSSVAVANQISWPILALIVAVAGLVLMNFTRFNVKERYSNKTEKVTLKQIMTYPMQNKQLLFYLMSFMTLSMTNLQGIVVSYFALYNLKNPIYISILMFISLGVQLLTALILPPIIKRFGKWKVNVISLLGLFTTGLSLFAIGYSNPIVVCVFAVLFGLFSSAPQLMVPMFTADCVEYGAFKKGVRASGTAFATQTFAGKLGGAAASGIVAYALAFAGYIPNVPQTGQVLTWIFALYAVVPGVGALITAGLFAWLYKIKEKDVEGWLASAKKNQQQTDLTKQEVAGNTISVPSLKKPHNSHGI
ncbi:glycoside-pentoside-hexuronide (GPH):cation symporter [Paenibacillus jamilae]|nr:glycoside-pentoside-hexuronide (GPH):cation symporter [Paenibacillus jamilae]